MIDHLMLQGLKPLSQETEVEDPNKEIEGLEVWKKYTSAPSFINSNEGNKVEPKKDLLEQQEIEPPIQPVIIREPEPGSYYTDRHLKLNEIKRDATAPSPMHVMQKQLFEEKLARGEINTPTAEDIKQGFIEVDKESVFSYWPHATEKDIIYKEDGTVDVKKSITEYGKKEKAARDQAKNHPLLKDVVHQKLSNSAIASYYGGIDELKNLGFTDEQLTNFFGTYWNSLSPEDQNIRYKKAVVEDVLSSSNNPEIKALFNSASIEVPTSIKIGAETVKRLNPNLSEEELDFLYSKWLSVEGKEKLFSNQKFESPLDAIDGKKSTQGEYWADRRLRSHLSFENDGSFASKQLSSSSSTSAKESFKYAEMLQQQTYENMNVQHQNYFNSLPEKELQSQIDEFKEVAKQVVPYYYGEFEGTDKLPLTQEQYVSLMSDFYSSMHVYGNQRAVSNLSDFCQNTVADNTSAWENTCSAVKQGAVNACITMSGWIASPIAKSIYWASGYSWEDASRSVDRAFHIMQTMGTILPWQAQEAEERYEKGLPGFQQRHYRTDDGGIGQDVGNLIESSGYMAGFVVGGSAIGKVTGGTSKVLATTARFTSKGTQAMGMTRMTAALTNVAQAEAKMGKILGQVAFASANANLEAASTSQDFRYSHMLQLEQKVVEDFKEDLAADIESNPYQWALQYREETGIDLIPSYEKSSLEVKPLPVDSEETKQILYDYFSQNEDMLHQYKANNPEYNAQKSNIEKATDAAYTTTFSLNVLPELLFNTALRQVFLPKSMHRSFSGAPKLDRALTIARQQGVWKATSNKVLRRTIATEYMKSIAGEALDEVFENIWGAAGTGVAEAALADLNDTRHGMYGNTGALGYDLAHAIGCGYDAAVASVFTEETLTSAVYGGVAAALGMPTLKGSVDWSKRKEGESVMQYLQRANPLTWDSVLTLPFGMNDRVNQEQAARDNLAEYVNAFLQDPEKQRMFENSAYATSLLNKLSVAQQTGDPKLIADAEAELASSTMSMLAAVKGTEYYNIITEAINARAKFSKENLNDPNSAESQAVKEYMADQNIKGPISHEAVLEGIINSAKQAQSLLQTAEEETKKAYEIYGDDADIEFIQACVINKLTLEDREKRAQALTDRIEEIHQKNFSEDPSKSSKLSVKGKERAAKYGTSYRLSQGKKIYAAEDYLQQLTQNAKLQIAQIQADKQLSAKDKTKQIAAIESYIRTQAIEVDEYLKELETLNPNEMVLTAEEILNMEFKAQKEFLSRSDHSKKQKAEIKRLGSLANDMIARGQLNEEIDRYRTIDLQLQLNPAYMMDFNAKAKAKAKAEIFKIKYSHLNREGISYEDFRKEYYNTAFSLTSQEDAQLLAETVKDNPHYAQLAQEELAANKAIGEIVSTEEYDKITKDPRKKANLDALLTYCATNGIPLDPNVDIDVLLQQLSTIDPTELQKALDRIETSEENKVLMSTEELAQMLKSAYNGVKTVREAVEKRNAEPEDTDATEANNADRTPVAEEDKDENSPTPAPTPEADPEKKATTETEKVVETEGEKKEEEKIKSDAGSPTKATKEELIQTMREIQADGGVSSTAAEDDIEQAFNWVGSTLVEYNPQKHEQKSAWDYVIDKSKMLPAKTQSVLQSIFAAMESKTTGAPVEETYTQDMAIEGHTGRKGDYMRKHRSYATLADNPRVKEGSSLRFYTPKELSDAPGELPVVALLEVEKGEGSVKLDGKDYAPIGFVTPTASMKAQNPTRSKDGDVFYSERATIQDVKKEGFAQEYHSKTSDIPVREAMKSDGKTAQKVQSDFMGKVKVGKNNKGNTVLQYPITRGTGNLTVDIDITPASPQNVKNQDGKTVFDSVKEFRETSQSGADRKAVAESAKSVVEHNEYTKLAAKALDGLNMDSREDSKLGVTADLLNDPTADVSAKLKKVWNGINRFIRLADYDSYTLQAENVVVDENGDLSFDLTLKQPTSGSTPIHLASISGVNSRHGISTVDIATALTNLMLRQDGQVRSLSGGASAFRYPVNYTDKEGNLNSKSVGRAFKNGVLVSNKPSFAWPATSLSFKYEHERRSDGAMNAEGLSRMTDNASPATTSENTVTTTGGQKVDADTGISQNPKVETVPEVIEKSVEEKLAPEEIIEEVVEEVTPVEDPFADAEGEDYSTFDEDDYDADDYQLVASRKSRIAKVKEFFKSLIRDLEGKEIYDEILEETTAEFEKYTKPGAFQTKKVSDRAKAQKEAEQQAEKIRAQKLPHIKSVQVVQNGDKGYSLQIKYNSYKRYLDLKAKSAETMTDAALKETINAFSDKEKVLNPSPKEAKKQLAIFQRFSSKSLKEKFNSLLSTPVSQKFEKLLSEVLSLHGIKTMERDIREANGKDILGAINTAGNIIYLAKGGERNRITLAEETAHALVKNIVRQGEKGDLTLWNLYQDIAATITETSLYQEVLDEYEDVYTDEDTGEVNYAKIKEEAIAKAMAVAMAEKYDHNDNILSSVSSLLTNAIDRVRSFLKGSKISNGSEMILHQKLNKLVDQVMNNDVKQVKKQQRKDSLNVILEALGINTKDKHVKSEAEKRVEAKQKEVIMNSSARTIRFDYLTEATRQMLNKVGVTQDHWQFYPMELQEQLLKCLSRA